MLFPAAQAPTSCLPFRSRAARRDVINRLNLTESPLLKASTSSAYFMWYPVELNSLLPSATGVFQEEKEKKKKKRSNNILIVLFCFLSFFFLQSLFSKFPEAIGSNGKKNFRTTQILLP